MPPIREYNGSDYMYGYNNNYGETWADQYGSTTDQSIPAQSKRAVEYGKQFDAVGSKSGTPWGLIASLAASNLMGFVNGFKADYKVPELSINAGYGTSGKFGVGYTTQKAADKDQVLSEYRKGTTDALLSGNILGAASRWLWGEDDQKHQLELQNIYANRVNNFGGDVAGTIAIRNKFAKNHGNPESQSLYIAAPGIDNGGAVNAVVDPKETIVHEDGIAEKPIGGIPGKDSVGVHLQEGDKVLTSNYLDPDTGKTYAEMAEPLIKLQNYLQFAIDRNRGKNNQVAKNVAKKYLNYTRDELLAIGDKQRQARNEGHLPPEMAVAAPGIDNWGNVIQTIAGLGTAIAGIQQAKRSNVSAPDLRVKNQYESSAIKDLYSLRPDNLSVNRQLRDAEARGRYQLSSSGLTHGQKAIANAVLTSNTQKSIADALAQSQDRFNMLRAQADNAALNSGNATAQRDSAALQFGENIKQMSGSNKNNIIREYFAQIPRMLGEYWKNYSQLAMWKGTRDLYAQDIALERERLKKYGLL